MEASELSSVFVVIGIGKGGINAVNQMFWNDIQGVDFMIIDSNEDELVASPVTNRLRLELKSNSISDKENEPATIGLIGLEDVKFIRESLSRTKMVFLVAGLGGFTGTKVISQIAGLTVEMGILTIGVVTLPNISEGMDRMVHAMDGTRELVEVGDTVVIIRNERLLGMNSNQSVPDEFTRSDQALALIVKGIAEIVTVHGYINVDFADLQTVMLRGGPAVVGTGTADGENRAYQAASQALYSSQLSSTHLRKAKNILINIISGIREAGMDEIVEILDFVCLNVQIETDIIWGNCSDESIGDSLRVVFVATGLDLDDCLS